MVLYSSVIGQQAPRTNSEQLIISCGSTSGARGSIV